MSRAKPLGLKDQPIEDADQEALGLGEYAEVLTEFIQKCDTPLTIALQGDWGSGKTSLLTLIKNALDAESSTEKRYMTVWFNTWQYAQFNMSDALPLSMMSKIADALSEEAPPNVLANVKKGLWKATRMAVIGGASMVGQGDTAKATMDEAERSDRDPSEDDPAAYLEKIKEGLREIVQMHVAGPVEKVVVFIDDLDRLVPEKAVELLEAMKIFLDIDGCVYVIACDYGVVTAGLKRKFGVTEGELKGRSFFDKIIQVPFKMPTKRYHVEKYIEGLLKQIGVDSGGPKDIAKYRDLVEHSIEFNPRSMKRLLNMLQLLTILGEKRAQSQGGFGSAGERRRHATRVTFAILCMIERYSPIYDHLVENANSEGIMDLHKGLGRDAQFASLRERIGKVEGAEDVDQHRIDEAVKFLQSFVECLQLDDDEAISDDEIRLLGDMLSLSAVVSAGTTAQEQPRDFALLLRRDLNERYVDFTTSKRPKYGKFRMMGGVVYLDLPHWDGDYWFAFGLEEETYSFELRGRDEKVYEIGAHMCRELGWDDLGHRGELTDYFVFSFLRRDGSGPDSSRTFRSEVIERFDQVANPVTRLSELCRAVQG